MSGMEGLAEFLLARIAEDEAALRSDANDLLRGQIVVDQVPGEVVRKLNREIGPSSPWRVLAECEAKRRIVDAWRRIHADGDTSPLGGDLDHSETTGAYVALEFAMKVHALLHADHPDYRPEWRP